MKKVVSLLAAGTEIVAELGLGDQLIGISHECDYPDELLGHPRVSRPRFDPTDLSSEEIDRAVRETMLEYGSVYAIDEPLLEELNPDVVLTQAVCEVCAVPAGGAQEVVDAHGLSAEIVSLDAHDMGEIFDAMSLTARAVGAEKVAEGPMQRLRQRLEGVRTTAAGLTPPRVLALEWLGPPFVPGHWVPEMIEMAGGVCLRGSKRKPSTETTWDDLRGLDPDVVLVMPCGYDLGESVADTNKHRSLILDIAPRAAETGAVWALEAAYYSRSGPRTVTGIETLAGILHPDRFHLPDPSIAEIWEPA